MRRNWKLAVAGVLLVLVTGTLVIYLVSPPGGGSEAVELAPDSAEPASDSPPGSTPEPGLTTEPTGEGGEGAARVSLARAPEEPVPVQLVDRVLVEGTVADEAGVAIAEARLTVEPAEDTDPLVERSDERGEYRIGPLAPGTRRLQAWAPSHYPEQVDLELTGEEPLVRHDFRLRPRQKIAVSLVTSHGEPTLRTAGVGRNAWLWLGIQPVATKEDPGATFPVHSGRWGSYGIGRFEAALGEQRAHRDPTHYGTVTLHEPAPAWLSLVAGHQVLRKRPIDPSVTEVIFVVDVEDLLAILCEVTATLVAAEDGQPVQGHAVLAEGERANRSGQESGTDGFLLFERVSPANSWLIASAPGRSEIHVPVSLTPGERLDLGEVALTTTIQLRGRVTHEGGGAARVKLRWGLIDPSSGRVEWERRFYLESDPDGTFVIPGLARGIWVIVAPRLPDDSPSRQSGLAARAVRVDATGGSVQGIEVAVTPTTPITLAVTEIGRGSLRVEVLDLSGLPVVRTQVVSASPSTKMGLVPGAYEVVLSRGGKEVHRSPLYVGEEAQTVELRF